jgi:hypothetical protein
MLSDEISKANGRAAFLVCSLAASILKARAASPGTLIPVGSSS